MATGCASVVLAGSSTKLLLMHLLVAVNVPPLCTLVPPSTLEAARPPHGASANDEVSDVGGAGLDDDSVIAGVNDLAVDNADAGAVVANGVVPQTPIMVASSPSPMRMVPVEAD